MHRILHAHMGIPQRQRIAAVAGRAVEESVAAPHAAYPTVRAVVLLLSQVIVEEVTAAWEE